MSKTVLFALTSHAELGDTGRKTGAYAPEFAYPAAIFTENGYDIAFVSVEGGPAPLDGIKPDDTVTQAFLNDPVIAAKLSDTPVADALDPADYDVIYFAGGHGTMWDFPEASALADLAAGIYDHGGVVAAVCHGPSGLLGITLPDGSPLVQGKTVSSFTNEEEIAVGLDGVVPFLLEDSLAELGAKHQKAENFSVFAVTDTRLVTGQNPASAVEVARQAIDALAG